MASQTVNQVLCPSGEVVITRGHPLARQKLAGQPPVSKPKAGPIVRSGPPKSSSLDLWCSYMVPQYIWLYYIFPHLGTEWVQGILQQAVFRKGSDLYLLMLQMFNIDEPMVVFPMVPETLRNFMAYPAGVRCLRAEDEEYLYLKLSRRVTSQLCLYATLGMCEEFMLLCRAAQVEWHDIFPAEMTEACNIVTYMSPGSIISAVFRGGSLEVLSAVLAAYRCQIGSYVKLTHLVASAALHGHVAQVEVLMDAYQVKFSSRTYLGWLLLGGLSCKDPAGLFAWACRRARVDASCHIEIDLRLPRSTGRLQSILSIFDIGYNYYNKKECHILIPTGGFTGSDEDIVYTEPGHSSSEQDLYMSVGQDYVICGENMVNLGCKLNDPVAYKSVCGDCIIIRSNAWLIKMYMGRVITKQYGRVGADGEFHPLYELTVRGMKKAPSFRWFINDLPVVEVQLVDRVV